MLRSLNINLTGVVAAISIPLPTLESLAAEVQRGVLALRRLNREPKQWSLTKNENVNSFENWKQNLIYTLSLDANFSPFLFENVKWREKTKAAPYRDFVDDGEDVQAAARRTKGCKS